MNNIYYYIYISDYIIIRYNINTYIICIIYIHNI